MKNATQFIFENILAGKIDKKIGTELLTLLKLENKTEKNMAIIGMSAKLPLAKDISEYWANIRNGRDCITGFPDSRRRDIEGLIQYTYMRDQAIEFCGAGYLEEIDKFDYSFFNISPKEASLMDPNQRLFLETAWQAIEDAGYGGNKLYGSRTGLYIGYDGWPMYGEFVSYTEPSSFSIAVAGNISAIIASRLPHLLDLKGPSMLIDTACSSSLVALHLACQALRNGECEQALIGGIRIILLPLKGMITYGIESTDFRSKTFDDSADGTALSEGVTAILIKPLNRALEDGDHIYAVIKGSAINQDGNSISITAPNALAQEDVIVNAWKAAEVNPENISFIEAHGTGTRLGDPIEIDGIQKAFRRYTDRKQFCAIGSVKSNLGHLDNTAGLTGVIKAVMALKNREIPPTIHFNQPNRQINFEESPVYVNDRMFKWKTDGNQRVCGVSSFGFSGTNCHVVLEEAPPVEESVATAGPFLFTLSAKSEIALKDLVKAYISNLPAETLNLLSNICYTANTGRGHYGFRLALVVVDRADLVAKLKKLNERGFSELTIPGVLYGQHRIITGSNKTMEAGDITESIAKELGSSARRFIQEYLLKSEIQHLNELCRLYVTGAEIDWQWLYTNEKHHKVSLPVYPFERKRCWLKVPEVPASDRNLYYQTVWVRDDLSTMKAGLISGTAVILRESGESEELSAQLASGLRKQGAEAVIEVEFGAKYLKGDSGNYHIAVTDSDINRLIADIQAKKPVYIFHLATLTRRKSSNTLEQAWTKLQASQVRGVDSLFLLTKALLDNKIKHPVQIVLVSQNLYRVTGSEQFIQPENATLFGLGKVIPQEYSNLNCKCIDIGDNLEADLILQELGANQGPNTVVYRNGQRYVAEFVKCQIAVTDSTISNQSWIRDGGVYVITGGTGGIGLEIARSIAIEAHKRQKRVQLVLISRSQLPQRHEWNELLKLNLDTKLCNKIRIIGEIEEKGLLIAHYSADVSDLTAVRAVLDEIRNEHGKIHGIIHSAGIAGDGFIIHKDLGEFKKVLAPKVYGTWLLDYLTQQETPDFLVLFSSITALTGMPGQSDYTAANSYLDSYSGYLRKQGPRIVTINWAGWNETGMAKDHKANQEGIFKTLSTQQAITAFNKVMSQGISHIIIGELNFQGATYGKTIADFGLRLSPDIKTNIDKRGVQVGRQGDNIVAKPTVDVKLKGKIGAAYTATELKIARIWKEVLGFEEIDVNDNFFEIGGDSLIANTIANYAQEQLGRKIDITDVLKYSSIKEFSEYLTAKDNITGIPERSLLEIPLLIENQFYQVSPAQKRLFILNQFGDLGTSYNLSVVMQIEGELDRNRFEKVFNQIIHRHETLRTSFELVNEEPVQRIQDQLHLEVEYLENNETETNITEAVQNFIRPFRLNQPPLLRAGLIKLDDHKHVLIIDMHHIISDGTSLNNLRQEFISLYNGSFLPPLRIQYKEYAAWQNELLTTVQLAKQEEYWLKTFSGEIPVLNLPTDYPRPTVQSFEGDCIHFELDKTATEKLMGVVKETSSTLYMVLFAAFNVLLSKYSGQEDIVVGTVTSGRNHTDLLNMIGMFVNTLAIRNFPVNTKIFQQILMEVKQNTLGAFENQTYPFEVLLEKLGWRRDLSRNPLFDVAFAMQNMKITELNLAGLKFKPYEFESLVTKFDLTLNAFETDTNIQFRLEYSTKLFQKETIERLSGHFNDILQVITTNPGIKLSEIEILTEAEKHRILVEFNDTQTDYPKEKTIQQLFEEQVTKTPDNIAVIFQETQLTYTELNKKSNSLARVLREKGVGPDNIVGIMVERSLEMIVGILGILKAGGTYLPIDPTYPEERTRFMLEDSQVGILLTQKRLTTKQVFSGDQINLDEAELYQKSPENLTRINGRNDLAYIIYTSGSTGRPKGVMIEHPSIIRVVKETNYLEISELDKILQLSNYAFDGSVFDIFGALINSATLVLIPPTEAPDIYELGKVIKETGITILFATTALFNVLIELNSESLQNVRKILFGGERVSVEHTRKALAYLGPNKIIHVYGPTETTVYATYHMVNQIEPNVATIAIGSPLANTTCYILDQNDRLQPIGIIGELYISGDGLARGYLNAPELTSTRFRVNPFRPGERMYRTGDLARWLPDGNLEFSGRIDHQVKIRGFRIELGEIESQLLKHQTIKEAIVIDKNNKDGKYLVAYLVTDQELTPSELRNYLAQELPDYMIPTFFIQLDKLPLTPNGKVDRKTLPEPEGNLKLGVEYQAPSNEIEQKLAEIWQMILNVETIGIIDNFFELGGHSLKATVLVSHILKTFQVEVPLREVFRRQTIKELAEYIQKAEQAGCRNINPVEEREYYPVSSAQKRFYIINKLDGGTSYNMPGVLVIEGDLNLEQLEHACRGLLSRHEALRTSFEMINEEFIQRVHNQVEFAIQYQKADESQIDSIVKDFIQPFDLSKAPLFRVGLVKMTESKHVLIYDMHHIISDGMSMGILVKDFISLYQNQPLPKLSIQYKDFSVWQNQLLESELIKNQEEYWLKTFEREIPVLNIPTDYPRNGVMSFEGETYQFEINELLTDQLKQLIQKTAATLFMVILAAYNVFLARLTGQEDIIIGTPIAGRGNTDIENVIGVFLNTLALRNFPQNEKSFIKFLGEVKENSLKAFENQDYPFETLLNKLPIKRDQGRNPLFDIVINSQNMIDNSLENLNETNGLQFITYPIETKTTKFDILIYLFDADQKIVIKCDYRTTLYKRRTIEYLMKEYLYLLEEIVCDPHKPIRNYQFLTRKKEKPNRAKIVS